MSNMRHSHRISWKNIIRCGVQGRQENGALLEAEVKFERSRQRRDLRYS